MRGYLSGAMSISGKEDLNFSEFNRITEILTNDGHDITNPVELDQLYGVPPENYKNKWEYYLSRDLTCIIKDKIPNVIVFGDLWDKSEGVDLELFVITRLFKGDVYLYTDRDRGYTLTQINVEFTKKIYK